MTDSDRWRGRRVAVVAAGSVTGEMGGAERFYAGLRDALAEQGCDVDLISVPTDESTFDSILSNYARCRELDVSKYDLVISTKAPTYAIRHARHVVYLVHTVRVFYDMFEKAFPVPTSELLQQRRHIQRLDTAALGAAKHRFAIGHEVASRLRRWNGLDAEVLHPPLGMNRFRRGEAGDYFFLPGRLHPWKRVDLAIQAVMASSMPLRLLIAGTGEAEPELKHLAGGDGRIEFLGRVSDEKLVDYYAGCLAVLFLPIKEDYGYITLEAFSSAKAVITCRDSGEPLQFVVHGQNGWVCDPTAESIREAMEYCFEQRDVAKRFGDNGAVSVSHITWPNVARRLLESGFEPTGTEVAVRQDADRGVKVAVLDMQPIDPPVGGGRLRLLGLYHALGDNIQARYVGSYDWPGEPFRRHQLTPTLEEIDVPLSDAHHAAAQRLSTEAAGKVVIDIAFPRLGHLSASYLEVAREAVDWADVVIFSHPWVYPLVANRIRSSQLVVYDSQNVEGFLRAQLLDKRNPVEHALLREVVAIEYELGSQADLILACSDEDREMFERVYEWHIEKIRLVPNGVMAQSILPADAGERAEIRKSLGVAEAAIVSIFIGSAYPPNIQAARYIIEMLAPALPDIAFVVAGGVGASLTGSIPDNVRITGFVDDEVMKRWLRASDFAVNPMFSGSGTNIKMFDFMAAGLPVVTTAIGGRGISDGDGQALLVIRPVLEDFVAAIRELASDVEGRGRRGRRARSIIEGHYSWERISPNLGALLRRNYHRKHQHARPRRTLMAILTHSWERILSNVSAVVSRNDQKQHQRTGYPRRLLAIFTTWNVKCGIAEHAAYLAAALDDIGWDVIVLGNRLPPTGPVSLRREMLVPSVRVWNWDNITWTGSEVNLNKTMGILARSSPDVLLVQHHTGFLSNARYAEIVRLAKDINLPVVVETHNARVLASMEADGFSDNESITFIVHDTEEYKVLRAITTTRIITMPLPVRQCGVNDEHYGDRDRPEIPGTPLLGGFGFLRPHKGVKTAIQIVAALKPSYPDIKYVGYHAIYPGGESEKYLRECLAEASRLGVAESIEIDTEFREIGEIVDRLRQVDVVLLPYGESVEGASASANIAVSARRPMVASSSRIFRPLKDILLTVGDDRTETYVKALHSVLDDKRFAGSLEESVRRWADEHSYSAAARKLTDVVLEVRLQADRATHESAVVHRI